MSDKAIGIFDSGIGGLTVCKAIHDMLPSENIIYFGDTARFPYGTRSRDTIIGYSREITRYLLSREVKMIVIACNTSSAAALETLREEFPLPIVGVIEAGARAACARNSSGIIGVIATRATVNSSSYIKAIQNISSTSSVVQQQATLFVSLTEEGLTDHEITRLTVREYLQPMYENGVRTIILGCTHFPLLKKAINDVYPGLDLVDTGIEIAQEVKKILGEKKLARTASTGTMGEIELYASDITETMQHLKDIFFGNNGTEIKKLVIKG
ncbi:MAG: glutamate racemase [Spirochaetae bacterium HGW-Spirochaetae-1]|jgi:glutamate racemase|nr:MAG: glutamate racemase [Spirochaetae bacterium HGW-Spirochaetae-1]